MVSAKDNAAEQGIHQSDIEWDPSVSRDLFNVNDGLTGRDGGPYLDEVEQREGEKKRAAVEKRQPDLENPGPVAGTVLVTGQRLLQQDVVANIPSQDDKDVLGVMISKHVSGEDFVPNSQGTVPDQEEIDKVLKDAQDNPVESELASDSRAVPVPVNDESESPNQTPRNAQARKTAVKKTAAKTTTSKK